MAMFPPVPDAGRWFVPGLQAEAVTTTDTLVDGRIIYWPFRVGRKVIVDKLALRTSGTARDSTARVGIYLAGSDRLPDTLVAETADMDLNVAGGTTVTDTLSSPVTLLPQKQYWIAVIARQDSGGSMSDVRGLGQGVSKWQNLGAATATAALDTAADPTRINVAHGAWTSMPDPADLTGATYPVGTNIHPCVAAHISGGDEGQGPGAGAWMRPLGSGLERWYRPGIISRTGNNNLTVTAGEAVYWPFHSHFAQRVQEASVEVRTAVASAIIRIAIYEDNDGVPGALVAETADLDASTTGVKTDTGIATNLAAETEYWAAIIVKDASPQIQSVPPGSILVNHIGWDDATAALDGTNADTVRVETGLGSWSSAPDPAGTTTSERKNVPQVGFKIGDPV